MDDVLCNRVSRSSLTTEEDSDWTSRNVTSLDVQILVDNIQSVHLLALVLMKTLDLDIKDRFWIDFHTLGFLQVTSQFTLVMSLDAFQFFFNICGASEFQQAFELSCVMVPVAAQQLIQIMRQTWVGMHEPAAESNTVGLVIEFFRVDIVEGLELRVFQDFCMQSGNPIDTVSVVDIHVSHVHTVGLINDLHCWICVFSFHALVKLFDDWYQMRYYFFQEFQRPFFKSFCQNCVVRISSHLLYDGNCFIQIQTTFSQETNHFWDNQRWVGIIDLDDSIVCQIVQVAAFFNGFVNNQLSAI